jgi:ribosomal protein S18 acetylase RimI-like enzyme
MIKRLAWDSGFFGYEVGMAQVECDFQLDQFLMEAQKFQLVYLYSKDHFTYLPDEIMHIGTKVTFQKSIAGNGIPFQFPIFVEGDQIEMEGIYEFMEGDFSPNNGRDMNMNSSVYEALMDLALSSGKFSHFKLDNRLKNNEFERLYIQWINNAVSGKNKVLLYIKSGKIGGLITLALTQKAISEELRGIGIGSQLIQAALETAGQARISNLEVGTQKANLPAMALYQSNGFRLTEEREIYHYTCFKN